MISGNDDDVHLERLLIEADYYQLETLVNGLSSELAKRKEVSVLKECAGKFVFKVVGAPDVERNFSLGWIYVDNYQGNETTACSSSGSKVEALWRSNHCTACGEQMSFEKFSKHVTFFRPTLVVLKKQQLSNIQNSESLRDLDELVFDQSFG